MSTALSAVGEASECSVVRGRRGLGDADSRDAVLSRLVRIADVVLLRCGWNVMMQENFHGRLLM